MYGRHSMKMGSFSKQEGRLRIGALGKLGRFKSAAENFLVYIASIKSAERVDRSKVQGSSPLVNDPMIQLRTASVEENPSRKTFMASLFYFFRGRRGRQKSCKTRSPLSTRHLIFFSFWLYSQTCVQRPPSRCQICVNCWQMVNCSEVVSYYKDLN